MLKNRFYTAFRKIHLFSTAFGFNSLIFLRSIRGFLPFLKDYYQFKKFADENFSKLKIYPCLADRYDQAGVMRGDYFHQDLLIAKKIFNNNPKKHVDIGSRIDGFVAHVATFRTIEVFDIREITSSVEQIVFKQADFMKELPDSLHNYSDSVSSLHAMEHFGLGRYGDPLNPQGYLLGIQNLFKLCTSGGTVYISLPIGIQRLEFNAHRVFSVEFLLNIFKEYADLKSFSFVDKTGDLHESAKIIDAINSPDKLSCGIFELIKK